MRPQSVLIPLSLCFSGSCDLCRHWQVSAKRWLGRAKLGQLTEPLSLGWKGQRVWALNEELRVSVNPVANEGIVAPTCCSKVGRAGFI